MSYLVEEGQHLDVETADAAFWAVVDAVDAAEAADEPLPGDVPRMLHHVFDADMRHLLERSQTRTNMTCLKPERTGASAFADNIAYMLDDTAMGDLPLEEGRKCKGGECCADCSRSVFPTFANAEECDVATFPGLDKFTFNALGDAPSATILHFVRLIERVRRTIAHEYGLPLFTVLPVQAYSRKYVAGATQTGGGGSEGDSVTLHCDEETHTNYHYSCVVYLNTQGEDFEGGNFIFNDLASDEEIAAREARGGDDDDAPAAAAGGGDDEDFVDDEVWLLGDEFEDDDDVPDDFLDADLAAKLAAAEGLGDEEGLGMTPEALAKARRAERSLTPFGPTRGAAVIFSSGWENMHEVERITSGTRYAVPCFFTTCPVPEGAYAQMAEGKPDTHEKMADDWLHLLLAHIKDEDPLSAMGRVKELLMKWHYLCTPLDAHPAEAQLLARKHLWTSS